MNKTLSKGMSYKTNVVKKKLLKNTSDEEKFRSTEERLSCLYFLRKEKKENFAIGYENDINMKFWHTIKLLL